MNYPPISTHYYATRLARTLGHPKPKKAVRQYQICHPDKITRLKNQNLNGQIEPLVYAIPHQHAQHFTAWIIQNKQTYRPPKTYCPTCGHYGYQPPNTADRKE